MAGASIKKIVDFIWGEQDNSQEDYDEEIYNQDYADEYENEEETESEPLGGFLKRKNKVVQFSRYSGAYEFPMQGVCVLVYRKRKGRSAQCCDREENTGKISVHVRRKIHRHLLFR